MRLQATEASAYKDGGTVDITSQSDVSYNISLRLSADLKSLPSTFRFSRNKKHCDFVISDEQKRVSNVHFRIYFDFLGDLMLEDNSTNGTAVDSITLRSVGTYSLPKHHLRQGSIISFGADYKFIVCIP